MIFYQTKKDGLKQLVWFCSQCQLRRLRLEKQEKYIMYHFNYIINNSI